MVEEVQTPEVGSAAFLTAEDGEPVWEQRLIASTTAVLVVLYISDVTLRALLRPLWFDELISYYVALLPDLGTLWEALRQTADGQPPLLHLAMRASHALFGAGEWATRLPSMAAVGAMSWALYVFVGRRAGAVYGIAAILFAWNTWAYEYAYEARPYALLMGLCGLAFLCWRSAVDGKRRGRALACLAACIVALVSSHYYAGLLLLPLAAGELVRTRTRKKADRAVWCVLGLSPLALLLHLPLLAGVRAEYQSGFWSPVEWIDLPGFYVILLAPALVPAGVALAGAGLAKRFDRAAGGAPGKSTASVFPPHERAAIYSLAALPLVYVLVTMLLTGAFVYRYPLAAVVGISAVSAEILYCWLGPRSKAAWIACAVLFGAFVINRFIPSTLLLGQPVAWQGVGADLEQIRSDTKDSLEPIVISSPLRYLELSHYAGAALKSRFVHLADPEAAVKFTSTNSGDISLIKLAPWSPVEVADYKQFLAENSCFFVVHHKGRSFGWVTARLRSEGEDLEVLSDGIGRQVLRRCEETIPTGKVRLSRAVEESG